MAEALRPLLPDTAARIAEQLGTGQSAEWEPALQWGGFQPRHVGAPVPLFPKQLAR